MSNSPFSRMTQRSRGHARLLLSIIPVSLVLVGALVAGAQQLTLRERHRLSADFHVTLAYIGEQEKFLKQLQADAALLKMGQGAEPAPVQSESGFSTWRPAASVSFSMLCTDNCTAPHSHYGALGAYLADSFASFWSMSYFPSGSLFIFHPQTQDSLSVPELDTTRSNTAHASMAIHLSARRLAQTAAHTSPSPLHVQWVELPEHPLDMLGLLPIALPGLQAQGDAPLHLQAAVLFDKSRLREFFDQSEAPTGYRFWLSHTAHGVLVGRETPPAMGRDGFSLGWQGLSFQIRDPSGNWTGRYLISPSQLLHNSWIPAGTLLFLLLSLLGGIGYARWYGHRVIEPARQAQQALLDSEAFSRRIIDASPVALAVIGRDTGQVIFGNDQALRWLGVDIGDTLPAGSALAMGLGRLLAESRAGGENTEELDLPDGRKLHMACAPSRYQEQDVLLCVLMDLSAQEEIRRELERARAAADEASTAKSNFLATMSHEIRTPLYGVLGSLELLSMTTLEPQQQQQVERIQGASRQLLQIISDILDISRIEAGQTQVKLKPFDPVALIHECTATFAAMAQQKNVLLFSSLDPDVPRTVVGDPLHIRQVLSNLISNAVKFTQAGHVIVRLRHQNDEQGRTILLFQVADSGIGIERERQDKLFTPFYVAHSSEHTLRGAGLGLSICARLTALMGSHIQLTSEPGLGSSFSFTLALDTAPAKTSKLPDLSGMALLVRTPHAELSACICAWLNRWGAQAQALLPGMTLTDAEGEILLDVLMPGTDTPEQWPGRYLSLSARDGNSSLPGTDGSHPESIGHALEQWRKLPAALDAGDAPLAPPAAVAKPTKPGLHVLVAEDNPLNQATLREQLEQLGCLVTLANDGDEALKLWDEDSHDLLLTDVNMPTMNGYELTQHLRARGVRAPIIGITANAMLDEAQRCQEAGMDSCLVKPMNLATLRRLLDSLPVSPVPRRYRAVFRQTMEADLAALEHALQEGSNAPAQATAHRIAGALAVMGQQEMAASFRQLEDDLRQNRQDTTGAHAFLTLCAALRKLLEQA